MEFERSIHDTLQTNARDGVCERTFQDTENSDGLSYHRKAAIFRRLLPPQRQFRSNDTQLPSFPGLYRLTIDIALECIRV